MLSKYYERVEYEISKLRFQKKGTHVCRGQQLQDSKALSFHCYEPLCDKQHCDEPDYKRFKSNETFFREQIAVSELCESFEIVRTKAVLAGTVAPHQPTVLRRLDHPWNSRTERAALEALFDETAGLLAMLHMEVDNRRKQDCIDPDHVYGSKLLSHLENAIKQLWKKELYLSGDVKLYKDIANHLRTLSEGLIMEGWEKLIADPRLKANTAKAMMDRVIEISRLQDQDSELRQDASSSNFPQRLPAFQEACSIVCNLAASSGAHANEGKHHFKLAENLGNNYIIMCNATVQACALYNQFAVAWYNRSHDRKLPPLDNNRLSDMQDGFLTYLSSLKDEVWESLQRTLEQIKAHNAKAARREEYVRLAGYLKKWWTQAAGKLAYSLPLDTFFDKLIQWFKDNNLVDQLFEYEEELKKKGLSDALLAASKKICIEEGGQALYFLSLVVIPLLDTKQDDVVDRRELYEFQVTAEDLAETIGEDPPAALNELLDVICVGCDLKFFLEKAVLTAESQKVDTMAQQMQVRHIIQSYDVPSLLERHVAGTRQWLFNKVNAWLDMATKASEDADGFHSRMFLLLAGPGMGKSVFSAVMEKRLVVHACKGQTVQVRHFFKVGEQRAQGKAMVLCLAQQLADQVPGMAALLEPVANTHGNAAALSMMEAFTKYLLEPLTVLDNGFQGQRPLTIVILLDALDEASDGNAGFQPVAALIAREFIKLPPWVKLIVTGRPQMENSFSAWAPEWMEPSDKDNQEDMRMLLEAQLQQGGFVATADLKAAIQVLLKKSQGQFLWVKYAFDELSAKDDLWTPDEMQQTLPIGLYGAYKLILTTLKGALDRERPDLLRLLQGQLLPVLVAALEPLTPAQLAVIMGAEMNQVEELLHLLPNLFPTRLSGSFGAQKVFPYHKSVLDWLVDGPAGWGIDAGLGHSIIASACFHYTHATAAGAAAAGKLCEKGDNVDASEKIGCAGGTMTSYALRYGVSHLCTAGEITRLEELVLDFAYFWPTAYAAGFGPDLLRDLIALGPISSSPAVKDVTRWLRLVSPTLTKYPEAALQLACDAPAKSIVSQQANNLLVKPLAKLLTKEDKWPMLLSTLTGHTSSVSGLAVANNTMVSISQDGTLRVWDFATGECRSTLQGHFDYASCIAISVDGLTCVSGSGDMTIWVWNLSTGECISILEGHSHTVSSVAISLDGLTCVSGSMDNTVRVWDLNTGNCRSVLIGHTCCANGVAISPDGLTCVSGSSDNTVRVWDLSTGMCRSILRGHSNIVSSVAISPDSLTCVTGSFDKTVRVWNLNTEECCSVLQGHSRPVTGVVISVDGMTCVSSSIDKTVRIWDLNAEDCRNVLQGHSDAVTGVDIGMDMGNLTCVSISDDRTVRIWDLDIGECCSNVQGHSDVVTRVAISADGSTCVSGSFDRTIRVWNLNLGECHSILQGHSDRVVSVAISADGSTCVSGSLDKTIRVWDLSTGECRNVFEKTMQQKKLDPGVAGIRLCFPALVVGYLGVKGRYDWSLINSATYAFFILFELALGCLLALGWLAGSIAMFKILPGHSHAVKKVAISMDGLTCVSGSDDMTVRVWDLNTGVCRSVLEGHSTLNFEEKMKSKTADTVMDVVISADNMTCVSASSDKTVRVWDLNTGECRNILRGHSSVVTRVAISADGLTGVSGSFDMTVRVWDLITGKCRSVLQGHSEYVWSVAIALDGLTCVSESLDGTVRTWDIASSTQLSCYKQWSLEGQRQLQLAAKWQMYHQDTTGPGHVQPVGIREDNAVIYWNDDDTSNQGGMCDFNVYLLPHLCPKLVDSDGRMFFCTNTTVSFFNTSNKFTCYQLMGPSYKAKSDIGT